VAAEVAHSQLAERLVALEVLGLPDPLVEQGDELLTSGGGTEDQSAGHGEVAQDVDPALPARVKPSLVPAGEQVRPPQLSATGQRFDGQLAGPL